jgi:tRNA(Ile)-lysidine synthase
MIKKIIQYIEKFTMIKKGDKLILAVSGGADSIALLDIMQALKGIYDLDLLVAHVNHSLRPEADEEEDYVKKLAAEYKIPCYVKKVDAGKAARTAQRSLEDMARQLRYDFFYELLKKTNSNLIATGHHKDDVAETVLLHLLRGSGIKGLRGIMPVNGNLIRPLLPAGKQELITYLEGRGLRFYTDVSNFDTDYMRNRIRHQLIPYLQAGFNPRIIETLNQLASIAREENEAIERRTEDLWPLILIKAAPEEIVIDAIKLDALEIAFQRRLILMILGKLTQSEGWNMQDVEKILQLINKTGSSRVIKLKKGLRVIKVYDKMIFITKKIKIQKFCYQLNLPGTLEVKETGATYEFSIVDYQDYLPAEGEIYLDYDKLEMPLVLRSRLPGDYFRPLGMQGRKKIKDYLIDCKIPYFNRDKQLILSKQNSPKVYCLIGHRIDGDVAVTMETQKILVIKKLKKAQNNKVE